MSKGALGYTMEMPEEDRFLMSRPALEQRLAVMLGGRVAELLPFVRSPGCSRTKR
jgi:cell division protease FtsH